MGVTIVCRLGSGDQGTAWLLDDGSVLKATVSQQEAAICQALQDRLQQGLVIPAGVPGVYAVRRIEEALHAGDAILPEPMVVWLIVREAADTWDQGDESDTADMDDCEWHDILIHTGIKWFRPTGRFEDGERDALLSEFASIAEGMHRGRDYDDVVAGLHWFHETFGIVLNDIRPDNIGLIRSRFGMFDFGHGYVPADLERRVLEDPALALAIRLPPSPSPP